MNAAHRTAIRLAMLIAAGGLAGCLTGEQESSGFTPVDTDPPPTNGAPTISGNPPSAVTIGETYSFTPTASDPDRDTLTFSVENKPAWAEFDSTSGRISGAPAMEDIGSYADIRISASDGELSAALADFTITVNQVAVASTTLSWTAPTQNEDGTALTDLSGFKIYYGTSPGNYTSEIEIDNPSVTTYVVENLSPNTYYFVATAINLSGEESRYSGVAVKTLN